MLRPNDSSQASTSETAATTSLQPMGFTDILDTMFSLYRNHFRLLIVSICSCLCSSFRLWSEPNTSCISTLFLRSFQLQIEHDGSNGGNS